MTIHPFLCKAGSAIRMCVKYDLADTEPSAGEPPHQSGTGRPSSSLNPATSADRRVRVPHECAG